MTSRLRQTSGSIRALVALAGGAVIVLLLLLPGLGGDSDSAAGWTGFSGKCTGHGRDLTASDLGDYEEILSGPGGTLEAFRRPNLAGRCFFRVTVSKGDSMAGESSTNRTELSGPKHAWSDGDDVWYSLSLEVPTSSPLPSRDQWMVLHQFFAQDISSGQSGGSPPVALELTPDDTIDLHVRGGKKESSEAAAPKDVSRTISDHAKGSWHEYLLHVVWSTDSRGLVEVWSADDRRGFTREPQAAVHGPNLLTVGGEVLPVYPESGIYRSKSPSSQTVYFGGLWARPERSEAERSLMQASRNFRAR